MKKVIYTVITGGYDPLTQPRALSPEWDYICFCDSSGRDGAWQLRTIPYQDDNPVLRARYVKMHPHELLGDYDVSVFMDANLTIESGEFYDVLEKSIEAPLALLEHFERDCVFDEIRKCFMMEKASYRSARKCSRSLAAAGMPTHYGLYETNVVLRRHNLPRIKDLDNLWWKMLLESEGTRDQFCLTPAMWTLGMKASLLFGKGKSTRNVPYVSYNLHPEKGRRNIPGRIDMANLKYNIKLLVRKILVKRL